MGIISWFLFTSVLSLHIKPCLCFAQEKARVEIVEDNIYGIGEVNISSDRRYIFIMQFSEHSDLSRIFRLMEPYNLTIIDLVSGKIKQVNVDLTLLGGIKFFCSTLDNRYLIIGKYDTIYVYNLQRFTKEKTIKLRSDLGRIAKCIDNKHILLGYETITLFNLLTGKEVWSFDVKGEYILFSPDGKYLITERELWDINKAEVKHTLPEGSYFAGFSPDSKYAIVIEHQKEEDDDGNNKIKFSLLFLNISNLKIDKRFDDIEPPEDRTSITFSCDKRYIVYKTGGNSLGRLDITNGEYETFEIGTDNESILSVYRDNILLASEYRLRIVDITNGETIITMILKSIEFGKERGWVVLTNKGYYDSSSYSIEEEILRVVEGNKKYNINLYRNKFRKPEIVKSVFASIYSSCNK